MLLAPEVAIVYSDSNFRGVDSRVSSWPYSREPSQTERDYEPLLAVAGVK